MGAFNEENNIALLSVTVVDHSGAAQTTFYTVPSGFICWPDHFKIKAAGDEAETDITAGQVGALTDFMGTTQLNNLDAANDMVKVQPIPADPPVMQKCYAAGVVLQIDVVAANGNAGNIYRFFGSLEAV